MEHMVSYFVKKLVHFFLTRQKTDYLSEDYVLKNFLIVYWLSSHHFESLNPCIVNNFGNIFFILFKIKLKKEE